MEKKERLRSLMEQMVSFVPPESLQVGIPIVIIAETLQVEVPSVYRVWTYDQWPYRRIDVDGMTIGLQTPSAAGRDILGISWASPSSPQGLESRNLFIPPVELDEIEYETYVQLRQDGCPVDRAAELAVNLHEAAR